MRNEKEKRDMEYGGEEMKCGVNAYKKYILISQVSYKQNHRRRGVKRNRKGDLKRNESKKKVS